MESFDLNALAAELRASGGAWREFLRAPSLSLGVYCLKAGQTDAQKPHTEDEVYYVVAGRAKFRAGDDVRDVSPGSTLFVPRLVEHRFFEISEDLTILVFFAPPEGSLQPRVDHGR